MHSQTSFETARGISDVESSAGYALVSVSFPAEDEYHERLSAALDALRRADLSIDFLRLAPDGFAFVLSEDDSVKAVDVLCASGFEAEALRDRTIISVRAPNIRDESGLVARIAEMVVSAGAAIDHVGDMHSSVQIVVESAKADAATARLRECVGKVEIL